MTDVIQALRPASTAPGDGALVIDGDARGYSARESPSAHDPRHNPPPGGAGYSERTRRSRR
jgi:hypothetical protein